MFPESATRVKLGKYSLSKSTTANCLCSPCSFPSPEEHFNLRYTFFPATVGFADNSFPKDVVLSNAFFISLKLSSSARQSFNSQASLAEDMRRHGARVIP